MNSVKYHIKVEKTARYYVLGNIQLPCNELIFVLHGYGMAASDFISEFRQLASPERVIIAPEGLSRFYKKGFNGEVVASWMTREDREEEILDYITYLNSVYDHLQVNGNKARVFVIGYSQGASTASRWVMEGKREFEGLVLWSGGFAPDLSSFCQANLKIWNIVGDRDEFISIKQFHEQTQYIENKGYSVTEVIFKGGHRMDNQTLEKVWAEMSHPL